MWTHLKGNITLFNTPGCLYLKGKPPNFQLIDPSCLHSEGELMVVRAQEFSHLPASLQVRAAWETNTKGVEPIAPDAVLGLDVPGSNGGNQRGIEAARQQHAWRRH